MTVRVRFILLILFPLLSATLTRGQDMQYTRYLIDTLCSEAFYGRGYIEDGVNKAGEYLEQEFRALKLRTFGRSYSRNYAFPVNTHPFPLYCSIDGKIQQAGYDFLADPSCGEVQGKFRLLHYNTKDSTDRLVLEKKISSGFANDEALVLHHYGMRDHSVLEQCRKAGHFPALFIVTEDKKLTHSISSKVEAHPQLIFIDSMITNGEWITVEIRNQFISSFPCKNLCAYVKGKRNDSLVVFTAHYDHLGMQGPDALFPGASDNASGVSMVMNLARHYARHKPDFTTVFILFSGEEAGLLGSDHFTHHSPVDLKKIRMLVNIDIMGNAEKGIVVVNGEEQKGIFDRMTAINNKENLLPGIRIRGKARNSDHYHFAEYGVPAVFIYSDGGVGYYHDVFDKANTIALTNYEKVFRLLTTLAAKP